MNLPGTRIEYKVWSMVGKHQIQKLHDILFSIPQTKKGFTLIELLIAISIIGIIFGVLISSFSVIQKKGRDSQRIGDLRAIQSSLQQYYADQGYFPDDNFKLSSATELTNCTGSTSPCTQSKTYTNSIPKDPSSNQSYSYRSGLDSGANKGSNCNYSLSQAKCHYYFLCAILENPTPEQVSQSLDCQNLIGSNYNFQINPL